MFVIRIFQIVAKWPWQQNQLSEATEATAPGQEVHIMKSRVRVWLPIRGELRADLRAELRADLRAVRSFLRSFVRSFAPSFM